MESKIDRELEQKLKGFEQVWQRVAGAKSDAAKSSATVMPRKCRQPKRRFEGR